jgi:hypothetical protein
MNPLVKKVGKLLPKLEARGEVYLYAVCEREDIYNRWDVLFSSAWSDEDRIAAMRVIFDLLHPLLTPDELILISRVVVFRSSEPAILNLPHEWQGTSKDRKVFEGSFMGVDLRRIFLFKGKQPQTGALVGSASTGQRGQ